MHLFPTLNLLPPSNPKPPHRTIKVSRPYGGRLVHDPYHWFLSQLPFQGPPSDLPQYLKYTCGAADAQNTRDTMEDSHILIAPFGRVRGQGFFAVFDGHSGPKSADWCGQHFHEYLKNTMNQNPAWCIPCIFKQTYKNVDTKVCKSSDSGCTAVTAFLRIEDLDGNQSCLSDGHSNEIVLPSPEPTAASSPVPPTSIEPSAHSSGTVEGSRTEGLSDDTGKGARKLSEIREAYEPLSHLAVGPARPFTSGMAAPPNVFTPAGPKLCRVLYCANAGDSRGVLCRGGKAIRLTYDHKGSDKQEAKRIVDAGGYVRRNRVVGMLAVSRSLGDSDFKTWVIGQPHTTATTLGDEDEFVILACDGLWDIAEDQEVIDHVRYIKNPQEAADELVKWAQVKESGDNITVVVIRLRDPPAQEKSEGVIAGHPAQGKSSEDVTTG